MEAEERTIVEQGAFEQPGFLLVQASASAQGVSGNVVVDVRRADGTGGSLRAARTTVDYTSSIYFAHITMPLAVNEAFVIYAETRPGASSPTISVRRTFL